MNGRIGRIAPAKPPRPLEKDIQATIMAYLRLRGLWVIRFNAGAMAGTYKGREWFVRFASEKVVDLFVLLPGGRAGWIEVKRPGEKLLPHQAAFIERAKAAGAVAFAAYGVEDVVAGLAAAGY